jgi:hypothetical protein
MQCASAVRTIVAALGLLASVMAAARGDHEAASHVTKLAARDFDGISFREQTEFEISDPDLVPRQLARAAEQSACHYKDGLERRPIRFLQIERRRFAIVRCFGATIARDQIFDFRDLRRPQLLQFPIAAAERGFTVTNSPGAIVWNKDTKMFEVEKHSDMCGTPGTRHVYRLSPYESGLSLVGIDLRKDGCAPDGE